MKLLPEETQLVGKWVMANNEILADDTCKRIHWLTKTQLREVAISKEYGAWETLFKDPNDGRFWERVYPEGDLQGGGPPSLVYISEETAKAKYEIVAAGSD